MSTELKLQGAVHVGICSLSTVDTLPQIEAVAEAAAETQPVLHLHAIHQEASLSLAAPEQLEALFSRSAAQADSVASSPVSTHSTVHVDDVSMNLGGRAVPILGSIVTTGYLNENAQPALTFQHGEDVWLLVAASEEHRDNAMDVLASRGAAQPDLLKAVGETQEVLGGGACAAVLAATAKSGAKRGQRMAMKLFNATGVAGQTEAQAEVALLVAAQGHPNIVEFYGLFVEGQGESARWAAALQCCAGGSLYARVTQHGACSEFEARRLAKGIFEALAHLHSNDLVHRDVKPENVLLNNDAPVLVDFGFAARLSDAESMSRRCGSPGFCAPELYNAKKPGPFTAVIDTFSAGAVLWFVLSGERPFFDEDVVTSAKLTLTHKPIPDSDAFKNTSLAAKQALQQFITKKAASRPTAQEALASPWLTQDVLPKAPPRDPGFRRNQH